MKAFERAIRVAIVKRHIEQVDKMIPLLRSNGLIIGAHLTRKKLMIELALLGGSK